MKTDTFLDLRPLALDAIESQRLKSDNLCLLLEIDYVYEDEQKKSEQSGRCSSGCRESNLVEATFGQFVCKWTRRPCEAVKLRQTISLLSHINRDQSPIFIEGVHSDCHLSR
jgi:hypothetical protein